MKNFSTNLKIRPKYQKENQKNLNAWSIPKKYLRAEHKYLPIEGV